MIFYPAYAIGFGSILVISEFKPEWLVTYLFFMTNYFGKGCFEIYLSSIPLSALSDDAGNNKVLEWVLCGSLLFVGLFHIFTHFCGEKKLD